MSDQQVMVYYKLDQQSTLLKILFYLSGTLSLLGHLLIWILPASTLKNVILTIIVLILSSSYSLIILYTFLKDPYVLLNMSYDGIINQYNHVRLIVSSVTHFGVTDLLAAYLIQSLADVFGVTLLLRIPMALLLFLWTPVGILVSSMIFYLL